MGSEKRIRQRENRQAKKEAERRQAKRTTWVRRVVIGGVILIVLVVVFWLGNRTADRDPAPAPPATVITTDNTNVPTVPTTTADPGS